MGIFEDLNKVYVSIYRRPGDKPISTTAAILVSIAYTLIYVIPFYLSRTTRPSPNLTRDAPAVIKARIRAVSISSILVTGITAFVLWKVVTPNTKQKVVILHELGLWPLAVPETLKILALLVILFIGPLFEAAVAEGKWRGWIRLRGLWQTLSSPMGLRNYVAGPITEELVFRSAIIPLHHFARLDVRQLIFLTPLYFGVAHMHHFYEFRLSHPTAPLFAAVTRTVIQFTYTTIFGWFAAFVFLRTGSLLAVIVAHSFCNWMGLPRFWGRVEAPAAIGAQDLQGIELNQHLPSSTGDALKHAQVGHGRLPIWYTVVYYVLLVAGAVAFSRLLWTWSHAPENPIFEFHTLANPWDSP